MPPYDFIKSSLYIVLEKNFKGYLVKNRSLGRRLSGVPQPHISMSGIIGFHELLYLSLDIFPHVAVEREPELAERAAEHSPFGQ
jgi:hypothetical protein